MIAGVFARTFVATGLVAGSLLWRSAVQAAELVIFEQSGCVYCQRWDREVGAVYGKTEESRALPLRRINIQRQDSSGVALLSPVRYTPTFVVVDDGREVGRITGYSNDNAFWGLLDAILARISRPSEHDRT